jgi:hypothetical protein
MRAGESLAPSKLPACPCGYAKKALQTENRVFPKAAGHRHMRQGYESFFNRGSDRYSAVMLDVGRSKSSRGRIVKIVKIANAINTAIQLPPWTGRGKQTLTFIRITREYPT